LVLGDIAEAVGKEGRHSAGFFGDVARRRQVMRRQSRSSWPMQIRPRESMKRTSASLGKTIASDRVRYNGIYARPERLHPSAKAILRHGHLSVTIRHTAIVAKTSGQAMVVIAHPSVMLTTCHQTESTKRGSAFKED